MPKRAFPLETDFGPRKSAERNAAAAVARLFGEMEVFIPATDEKIKIYCEEAYPQWLEGCKEALSNCHQTLQKRASAPEFVLVAENLGTRPATDALITIEAEGNFQIKPPVRDEENEDEGGDEGEGFQKNCTTLLPPPAAPRGRWQTTNPFSALHRSLHNIATVRAVPVPRLDPATFQPVIPKRRDPNAFYYKPDRPQIPQNAFCLECQQWRHEDGKEEFDGEIHFSPNIDTVEGALVFRIQAENLSKAQIKRIPVRIKTAHVSSFERARALVEMFARRPEFGCKLSSKETGLSSRRREIL